MIIGWRRNNPFSSSFGKTEARWSVDRSTVDVFAMGVWGCRISRATDSPRDWPIVSDGRGVRPKVRSVFPRLRSNPEAEGCRRPRDEAPFVRECRRAVRNLPRFSDLSRSRKELYRGLVVGSASDPLVKRPSWSMEEIRSQWNWAPG